jgi:F0F1-type ATP synthase assembly protein I
MAVKRDWQPMTLVTQLGVTMAVSIVLCLLLGLWIDSHFGTRPWATLALSLIGILAGSVAVYRMVSEAIDAAADPRQTDAGRSEQSRERRKENE